MTTTRDPTVHARAELVALVTATREDWTERDAHAAITHAANCGMTWRRVMVELVRLAADPHGEPRDLVVDHRQPRRLPTEDPAAVVDLDALRTRLATAQTRITAEQPAIDAGSYGQPSRTGEQPAITDEEADRA